MSLSPKDKFRGHRNMARRRGVQFLFTFEEWMKIWLDSGHWLERGRGNGKYQMARFGDKGPYATWNVKIILHNENSKEGNEGKILSEKTRLKMKIKRSTEETREKLRAGALRSWQTRSRIGKPRTEETKLKIANSLRKYQEMKYQ